MLTSTGATNGFFAGVLDEARVWSVARSQADIQATMDQEVTGGTGLVARWGMNEGSGSSIASSVGTFPGTLTSGPAWVAGAPFPSNAAPNAPALVSPGDGGTGFSTSPTLDVTVTDPDANDMSVTFYGRPVTAAAAPDFTIVTLPDTQNYTTSTSGAAIFNAQTQWIVDSLGTLNTKVASHLGDTVNDQADASQWTHATGAMAILDGASVPYGISPGNHDLCTDSGCATYNAGPFDAAFPLSKYSAKAWYTGGGAGAMAGREYRDSYQLLSDGSLDFIVINLEVNPPSDVVAWADGLLTTYASRQAIIVTHDYLTGSGTRSTVGGGLWTNLVSGHCNVFMVLSGHASEEAQLTSTRAGSCQPVYQVLQDYQGRTNGGDGWLRYYTFKPSLNRIDAFTWKVPQGATAGSFETDANSQFSLAYPMSSTSSWQVIGTATGVHSGDHATVSWNGLASSTAYEWYASVSDGSLATTGATWSFTTGVANTAPVAVADSYTTAQDTAKIVAGPGVLGNDTDADGDPLSAVLNANVAHGTLTLSADGGFTYTPSASYSGSDSFTYHASDGTASSNTVTVSLTVTGAYYVDNTVSCSDSGAGTLAQPFCTIGKGASVVSAGKTVRVLAGTYAETVNGPNSGTAGNPITYSAAPGVTVTGNGTANGNAFRMTTKSYIVVDGFTVTGTTDYGIYTFGSDHITISNNHVSYSGSPTSGSTRTGIYVNSTSNSTISGNTTDHNSSDGIRLTNGANYNTVSDNVSFANASGYVRDATGIDVLTSNYNTIIHNTTYANEDTGLNFYTGSHDNLVLGNLTYGNGDHGIDNNAAPNQVIVGNTVQGNVTVGINIEGAASPGSGGATVANNVMVDNGLLRLVGSGTSAGSAGNIRVDAQSQVGTTLDYNLYYLSPANGGTVQVIWQGFSSFTSLAAFTTAVPGQETHGLQANPLLTAPAVPGERPPAAPFNVAVHVGDYHLAAGSPAIDSANSNAPSEPLLDIEGKARIDDPATANTGAGTRTYDDRGAYEFAPPPNRAPVADAQSVTTAEDTAAPITLTGSDPDGDSLAYEVVDAPAHGTLTGTAPALTYTPDADYDGPDSFTFTVSDGSLTSAPATVSVTVTPVPDAPVITWPAPDPITYGAALDATQLNASADVDGTFAYSPDLGTVLHSGPAQVLAVTFTPTDTVHYATATAEVAIDVNPAPLTITADSQAKTYLDPLPDLTWTPGSFTNGDTAAVLSGSPACTTTATATSPVGAYPITCATGTLAAADYTLSFVDGSLTIGKADQAIDFGPLDPKTVGDPPFPVSATTTSPLAVGFAAAGACTVLADEVTLTGAGSCTITASQAGDDNWNAATPVDQTFEVTAAFTLSGTVKTSTGTALPGSIAFYDAGTLAYVTSVTVNASGAYGVSLPAGGYKLRVAPTVPGHPAFWYGGGNAATSTTVNLTTNTTLNIVVNVNFTLSGTVKTSTGTALPGSIAFYDAGTLAYVTSVTVNASGAYGVSLPAGGYKLRVAPTVPGHPAFWYGGGNAATSTTVNLTTNTTLNIVVNVNFTLSGTVKTSTGTALPGSIAFYDAGTLAYVTSVTVNASGAYGVSLPAGGYKLRVAPTVPGHPAFWYGGGNAATSTTVNLTTNTTLNIVVNVNFTLSGTVKTSTGTALPGSIAFYDAGTLAYVTSVTVNASGAYGVSLPAGGYKLRVAPTVPGHPAFWYGGGNAATSTTVNLTTNTTLNIIGP